MIELGSTATAYEPYFNGGTATCENLLSVGNYEDEQEVISGAVTRNVGVKVLDGSEDWSYDSGLSRFSAGLVPNSIAQTSIRSIPAYCTHFKMLSNGELIADVTLGQGYISGATATSTQMYFHSDITTVSGFAQWLADQYSAGTPVIIVYPLGTPTTETVSGQNLTLQDGTNILEITQASLPNLELEAEYLASQTP
jgi:hypothetical protein